MKTSIKTFILPGISVLLMILIVGDGTAAASSEKSFLEKVKAIMSRLTVVRSNRLCP